MFAEAVLAVHYPSKTSALQKVFNFTLNYF